MSCHRSPSLPHASNSPGFPQAAHRSHGSPRPSKPDSQRSSLDGPTHRMAEAGADKDAGIREALAQGLFGPRQHSLMSDEDEEVSEDEGLGEDGGRDGKEDMESMQSLTCCGRLHNCLALADFARAEPGEYSSRCGLCSGDAAAGHDPQAVHQ